MRYRDLPATELRLNVEADIIDTQGGGNNQSGSISIQVPDFIDLGNVSETGISSEPQIYMNNTGTVAIVVTPQLSNYTDDIFDYLHFREFKTSGGNPVTPQRIGNWSMNISAPSSGQTFRSKYFYMRLDLSQANIDLSDDLIGHQAHVRFFAVAR
jgi:hypothetical protein